MTMNDLILDRTITHAEALDFWPTQEKGRRAIPACVDLSFESGILKLTHAAMQDWVLVTPGHILIALPGAVSMTHFHKALAVGGALRNAFVELRCAAIADRGILTACSEVKNELRNLSEEPNHRGVAREKGGSGIGDPVFEPYSLWFYAIDRNGRRTEDGKPQVLAFPLPYVSRAREVAPSLAIYELDDLLEMGLSPVTAKIGVPKDHAGYEVARREWIELAIKSLVADIEEAVKGWPVIPGEPFQTITLVDDHLFFITLDTIDGVSVASSIASKDELIRFSRDVNEIGRAHLAHGLATLHRAVVS